MVTKTKRRTATLVLMHLVIGAAVGASIGAWLMQDVVAGVIIGVALGLLHSLVLAILPVLKGEQASSTD